MSTSSSESESEASDEAGDLSHPARNNVPRLTPSLQIHVYIISAQTPGYKLDEIRVQVLTGVLNGNIIV